MPSCFSFCPFFFRALDVLDSSPPIYTAAFVPPLPPLAVLANWLDVIALSLSVGRRATKVAPFAPWRNTRSGTIQAAKNQNG